MFSFRVALCSLSLLVACAGPPSNVASSPTSAPLPAAQGYLPTEPIGPIRAPFDMPQPTRPSIPAAVFDIRDFGAQEGGTVKATSAFRQAIAKASAAGGGTVLVPPGTWLTGAIHLKSRINLHVASGAVLSFSQDFGDYLPPVLTRWEGQELYGYSPLIYARDCEDVAVTGGGKLDGRGAAWWPWKKTQHTAAKQLYDMATSGVAPEQRVLASEGGLRPSFIETLGCKNVLIEGITLTNGPFWTIHPVYSENVIVRRVRVETVGPNNDGCNPDSSKNVLIEDSFFSTGDDCVVIKSGLNEDGWRVNRPSENIVVRRLHGEAGHGGVVIGSEMSGGVRNVWVTDSEFIGTDRGLRIKSMRGRGGTIENVFYENVRHQGIRLMVVELTTFYGSSTLVPKTQTPPRIQNVHVKNVTARGAKQAIDIVGLPELPIRDITFENVNIVAEQGLRCEDCENVRFERTTLSSPSGEAFPTEDVQSRRSAAPSSGR
ncbi:MAG: glycoside hydrolase family 28 [Polyangiaceae bacterium]|nr:glycoside hydrolase family 28 [Polyangiaceae bacterium]